MDLVGGNFGFGVGQFFAGFGDWRDESWIGLESGHIELLIFSEKGGIQVILVHKLFIKLHKINFWPTSKDKFNQLVRDFFYDYYIANSDTVKMCKLSLFLLDQRKDYYFFLEVHLKKK